MSTLIEQAAQRLEQLRQAGADMPAMPPVASAGDTAKKRVIEAQPVPLSRRVEIDLDALSAAGIVSPNAPTLTNCRSIPGDQAAAHQQRHGQRRICHCQWQPDHGYQRVAWRGQDFYRHQSGDEHGH